MLKKCANKFQQICYTIANRHYEHSLRRRLRNNQFSILCSNCIGGIIYHRLGLEFQSPTINLWMTQRDFIRFASDLKGYLSQELRFIEGEATYPIGMLGDVKIHFNHYKTIDSARNSWVRRAARIHWDSIYIIMYDRENFTDDELKQLKNIPCKKLIVLSDKTYPDIPYVKTMKRSKHSDRPNNQQYLDLDYFGIRTFERQFDFVKWLNDDQ